MSSDSPQSSAGTSGESGRSGKPGRSGAAGKPDRSGKPDKPGNSSKPRTNSLNRGLTGRHVQFIALGGAVGTGLFLGSGRSIALTGPSILLVYLTVGLIMFILMRAIGELMYTDPDRHSFLDFVGIYLGPAWGRFAGWTYWLTLVLISMTELTAVSQYCVTFFSFFGINLDSWRWAIEIGFMALLLLINLASAKAFGETEFWFSLIKVALIVGLILTGVTMAVIGFRYPAAVVDGTRIQAGQASIHNLIDGFSLAPNGWLNFLLSFQMVFYAYETIEMIGMTVSEMQNPRAELKKAVNQLIYRILIFYVGALAAIMMIVPWRSFAPKADGSYASPFILVFRYAGLNWASALVFFVVITAAASALNSMLFSAGRQLYQAAIVSNSKGMRALGHVSANQVPKNAILLTGAIILLAPAIGAIPGVSNLFTVFSSMSSATIVLIYALTMIAHWKYRRSRDFLADGFVLRGYKVWDSLAIAFFLFVYVTLFLDSSTLAPAILGLIWLVGFGWWCRRKEHRRAARRVA